MNGVLRGIAAGCLASLVAGCATGPARDDPFEPWNRAMYAVHEPIDKNVVQPVIDAYTKVVPSPVRTAISNFYNNIDDLISAINDGLQAKPDKMGADLGRVLINSGLGLGGMIDIASQVGVERGNEDFGQTFGVWGFGQGPYLFIPLFGPTTVRDGSGWLVRLYIGPTGYIPDVPVRNVLYGLGALDFRYQAQGAVDLVNEAALDHYAFIRRAYLQRRLYLLYDGKVPPQKEEP
ncbi:MAG TPA: VacJ family lipoprotein [Casimicrobiaceae bacterium]|nr:VacJ family lipoprotein [Casimicrobiaceae bacterium]